MQKESDQYSESETQRRFKDLVQRALNDRPRTAQTYGSKGYPSQIQKKRRRQNINK